MTNAAAAPPPERYAWLASRLAGCQLGLFVAIEMVERLAAHHSLHDLFSHGILSSGAVAQVSVAVLASAALWWLALTAERLRASTEAAWSPPRTALRQPIERPRILRSSRPVRPLGARAPPPSSVTG